MRFLGPPPLQLPLPKIWTLAQVGGKALLLIGHRTDPAPASIESDSSPNLLVRLYY